MILIVSGIICDPLKIMTTMMSNIYAKVIWPDFVQSIKETIRLK
jgi:hypothetical protein